MSEKRICSVRYSTYSYQDRSLSTMFIVILTMHIISDGSGRYVFLRISFSYCIAFILTNLAHHIGSDSATILFHNVITQGKSRFEKFRNPAKNAKKNQIQKNYILCFLTNIIRYTLLLWFCVISNVTDNVVFWNLRFSKALFDCILLIVLTFSTWFTFF